MADDLEFEQNLANIQTKINSDLGLRFGEFSEESSLVNYPNFIETSNESNSNNDETDDTQNASDIESFSDDDDLNLATLDFNDLEEKADDTIDMVTEGDILDEMPDENSKEPDQPVLESESESDRESEPDLMQNKIRKALAFEGKNDSTKTSVIKTFPKSFEQELRSILASTKRKQLAAELSISALVIAAIASAWNFELSGLDADTQEAIDGFTEFDSRLGRMQNKLNDLESVCDDMVKMLKSVGGAAMRSRINSDVAVRLASYLVGDRISPQPQNNNSVSTFKVNTLVAEEVRKRAMKQTLRANEEEKYQAGRPL